MTHQTPRVAFESSLVDSPKFAYRVEVFAKHFSSLRPFDAVLGEFVAFPSVSDTANQPTAAENVQRRELLCSGQRLALADHEYTSAEFDLRRD